MADFLVFIRTHIIPNHKDDNSSLFDGAKIRMILDQAGIPDRIERVQLLATGMLNVVTRVTFAGSHPDVVVRVRQFHHSEYGQEFAAERFAYPLIDTKNVNAPQLLFACVDTDECDTIVAVFEYIEGILLDQHFDDGTYSGPRKKKLLGKIAESLASIHEVKGAGYGTHTSISHLPSQRRLFFEGLFQSEAVRLRALKIDFASDYERVLDRWLDIIDLLPMSFGGPTLVHGDVHGRNLIISADEVFFLDWEASRFRIAPYDLAQLRYINLRSDPDASEFFIKYYIESSTAPIDVDLLKETIDICQYFWQCRMGLFFLQFPRFETPYFGSAREHLREVSSALRMFSR